MKDRSYFSSVPYVSKLKPEVFSFIFLRTFSISLFKLFYLFIFGCAGSSLLCGLSLVAESESYSLVAVCRLLIVVASFVAEHRL